MVAIPEGFEVVSQPRQQKQSPPIPEGFEVVRQPQSQAPPIPAGFEIVSSPSSAQAQPQEQQPNYGAAAVPLEFMAAFNRGATRLADFLTTDQINAVAEILGSEFRVPSITDTLAPATQGGFMDDGLARDVVRTGGEMVAPGVAAGQVVRQGAQNLPRFAAQSEGVIPGAVRQMGSTTAGMEARVAAGSGAGVEVGGAVGEAVGGEHGRQAGELLGGLGGGVATGARPMRNLGREAAADGRAAARQLDTGETRAAAEATGVDLFPAQQSLDPKKLRAQRFLPELSPATEKAAQALSRQNQQASQAVDDYIRSIAPDDSVVTAAGRFRNASQRTLEASRAVRAEKASPIYQRAFAEGAEVDLAPVTRAIMRTMSEFPRGGAVFKTADKVGRMLNDGATLRQLHNAKLELDDMLFKVGDGSLGNTARRELRGIKQILVDQMEAASPAYRDARLTFEAASPRVQQLEESIIGNVANLDDTQLKSVSRRIFDPSETNPSVVRQAKQVIDEVDPDAWDRLLRAEIERRIGSIRPEVGVSFENIPGKLNRAIFGTGRQRDALMEGMSTQQRRNAELLERALTRASLGRPGGSETAGRQQFVRELDSGVVSTVRRFLRNPIDRAIGVGESSAFDRRAKILADTLFDPAWAPEATRALKDPSGNAFGYLLYRVGDTIDRTGPQGQGLEIEQQ